MRRLLSRWDHFWFHSETSCGLSVFRVCFGLYLLNFAVLIAMRLFDLFGKNGVVSPAVTKHYFGVSLNLLLLGGDEVAVALCTSLALAGVCILLGLFTRWAIFVAFLCLVSFENANPFVLNGGDKLAVWSLLILFFSECGSAFSLDSWLRGARPRDWFHFTSPVWAQRLLQVQLSLVYLTALCGKLQGYTWLTGTAVCTVAHLASLQHLPTFGLLENPLLCRLLSWMTLLIEAALCSLVWIPSLTYYALAAGLIFHCGIDWCLDIPHFSMIVISMYVLFCREADLQRIFEKCVLPFVKWPILQQVDNS